MGSLGIAPWSRQTHAVASPVEASARPTAKVSERHQNTGGFLVITEKRTENPENAHPGPWNLDWTWAAEGTILIISYDL